MRRNDHSQEDKRRQEEAERRRKAYEQQAQQRRRQAEIDRQHQQAYRQQKKREREQMQHKHVGLATKAAANVAGHMTKNTAQRNAKLEGQIEQVVGKVLEVSGAETEGNEIKQEGLAKKQNAERYGQQQGEQVKKAILNAAKKVKQYKSIDVEAVDPTLAKNNQKKQTGPQFTGYGHHYGQPF